VGTLARSLKGLDKRRGPAYRLRSSIPEENCVTGKEWGKLLTWTERMTDRGQTVEMGDRGGRLNNWYFGSTEGERDCRPTNIGNNFSGKKLAKEGQTGARIGN